MPLALVTLLCAFILGGFGRRFAGGLLGHWGIGVGTQAGRVAFGICMAMIAFMAGLPWYWAIVAGAGFPVGLALRGNRPGMAMGRFITTAGQRAMDPVQRWRDAGWLTLHGVVVPLLPVLAIAIWQTNMGVRWSSATLALTLTGFLAAPIHELAWRFPLHIPALGMYGDIVKGPYDPPPTAEFAWGGVLGLGLALSIMLGVG